MNSIHQAHTFLLHLTLKPKIYNSIKGTNLNVKSTLTFVAIRNGHEQSGNEYTVLLNFATLGSTPIADSIRWLVDSKKDKIIFYALGCLCSTA